MSAVLSAVSLSTIARKPVFELLIRVPWGHQASVIFVFYGIFNAFFLGACPFSSILGSAGVAFGVTLSACLNGSSFRARAKSAGIT